MNHDVSGQDENYYRAASGTTRASNICSLCNVTDPSETVHLFNGVGSDSWFIMLLL